MIQSPAVIYRHSAQRTHKNGGRWQPARAENIDL